MKLGTNLQYLRKLHGNMTQEKLAEQMGVCNQNMTVTYKQKYEVINSPEENIFTDNDKKLKYT